MKKSGENWSEWTFDDPDGDAAKKFVREVQEGAAELVLTEIRDHVGSSGIIIEDFGVEPQLVVELLDGVFIKTNMSQAYVYASDEAARSRIVVALEQLIEKAKVAEE